MCSTNVFAQVLLVYLKEGKQRNLIREHKGGVMYTSRPQGYMKSTYKSRSPSPAVGHSDQNYKSRVLAEFL